MESEDRYTHNLRTKCRGNIQKKERNQSDIYSIIGHNTEDNIQKKRMESEDGTTLTLGHITEDNI